MQETSSRQPDGRIASIDRPSAQARLDRIRAFSQELAALEQEGVATLEPDERRAIDEYHQSLRSALTTRFDVDVGYEPWIAAVEDIDTTSSSH